MSNRTPEIITSSMVLDNIEQVEVGEQGWWKQLEGIINSGRGDQVYNFLDKAIALYYDLESLAQNPQSNFPQTAEEASRIKAIWVKSAHGTYLQPTKDDRFKGKAWVVGNDRDRMNYALSIAHSLVRLKTGENLTGNWNEDKKVLEEHGPWIIYAGRWDENRDLRTAASNPQRYFPSDRLYPTEKFFIVDGEIDNLIDVIRNFQMPPSYHPKEDDEIGIISHTPQAMRFLFMLAQIENRFPKQAAVRMFPMVMSPGGFPEYPLQELRGTVYYRFISTPQFAAGTPYPFS